MASLARQLRNKMLERPHLIALVHEQAKTPLMFLPAQAAMAAELAALGKRGATAALSMRALQMHVIASVVLERTIERLGSEQPMDTLEVFEFTLQALLDVLEARAAAA